MAAERSASKPRVGRRMFVRQRTAYYAIVLDSDMVDGLCGSRGLRGSTAVQNAMEGLICKVDPYRDGKGAPLAVCVVTHSRVFVRRRIYDDGSESRVAYLALEGDRVSGMGTNEKAVGLWLLWLATLVEALPTNASVEVLYIEDTEDVEVEVPEDAVAIPPAVAE